MYQVKQLLNSKGSEVWWVEPDAPIHEVLAELARHDVGALLVLDAGKLVGIVSERDIVRRLAEAGQYQPEEPVSSIMSSEVITLGVEDTLEASMLQVLTHHIRHLPIVDEQGHLAGVLSIGDILSQCLRDRDSQIIQLENYIEGHGYIR